VSRRHFQFLHFRLLEALGLRPPVLEPDFHLSFCEGEGRREFGALRDGQILLLVELAFEGQQLLGCEGRAGLAVGLVLAKVTRGGVDSDGGAGVICERRKTDGFFSFSAMATVSQTGLRNNIID
jgi:hypothetical protein